MSSSLLIFVLGVGDAEIGLSEALAKAKETYGEGLHIATYAKSIDADLIVVGT